MIEQATMQRFLWRNV